MKLVQLTPAEWRNLSEHAHLFAFGRTRPKEWDRIDFAVLAVDELTETPMGYATCREHDVNTLYLQFGGTFPGTLGTAKSFRAYTSLIEWCRSRYERVTTFIENSNLVMLKMAMRVGFRIQGVRHFNGTLLVDHLIEFEKGV
jgi:hypothetical protein